MARDKIGSSFPQYFDTETNNYETVEGKGGAISVIITDGESGGDGSVSTRPREYFGNSTDVKPLIDVTKGSTFFEIDKSVVNMFDGTKWMVI